MIERSLNLPRRGTVLQIYIENGEYSGVLRATRQPGGRLVFAWASERETYLRRDVDLGDSLWLAGASFDLRLGDAEKLIAAFPGLAIDDKRYRAKAVA